MELSEEQQSAVDKIVAWRNRGDPLFRVGGLAGVGKTTIAAEFVRICAELGMPVNVCGFTGKAVSVLRSKGLVGAQTLHSLMYDVREDRKRGKLVFVRRESITGSLVVVDEGQMVNQMLWDDLRSFRVPILVFGDIGQLEPIGDNPHLMREPDVTLETIHRQAAGSPIIKFAYSMRNGRMIFQSEPGVYVGDRRDFYGRLETVDQIIVGFNQLRVEVNSMIRKRKGYYGVLCDGDRVICLRNNRDLGVYNGMTGMASNVRAFDSKHTVADVTTDDGRLFSNLLMVNRQFGEPKTLEEQMPEGITLWDYGYAITCHKGAGSEWESVMVYEQIHPDWDWKRWGYTAATRASKSLVYCRG